MMKNQNEAKLKASIAEFIGPLERRLQLSKAKVSEYKELQTIINQIINQIAKRKSSVKVIENRDSELTDYFGKIERQIGSWIDDNDEVTEMNEGTVRIELKDILDKLVNLPCEESSDLPQNDGKAEVPKPPKRSDEENELSVEKDLEELDVHSSLCLYSLGIFPESTKLKKGFVIHWWIGLGLLPRGGWEMAVQHGDNIFSDLMNKGFLKSEHTREHNKVIKLCTINLTIYERLFSNERADFISPFFGDWFNKKLLLNHKRYLNSEEITRTAPNLQVVQLGNWRYTETKFHSKVKETGSKKPTSNDHIEVDKIDFLNKLGGEVTYLSLRGISGIEEIPESIGKLENLMILDLRSCHNLNQLPQKPRSTIKQKLIKWKLLQQSGFKKLTGSKFPQESWFKKLMVLDISECYLLDYMPRWICELSNLEVLKGFVVGSMDNNNQSCRLRNLSKLKKLRKLTIRIAREHSDVKDFSGLTSLQTLLVLTIIWGDNKSNTTIPAAHYFPENLEKLDIRCYPADAALDLLNPGGLKNLKRLYIRGGNLTKIPCNGKWNVEILRLRFLKRLDQTDWNVLKRSFQKLRYVEYVECATPKNFPNDGSSWSKE